MSLKIVVVALAFLCLPVFAAFAGPTMQTERADHDFGTVIQGTKVEHVFVLRNTGDETLIIDQVRSSCGCTAALLSASQIPPGGVGEIRTVFDSGRFRGAVRKSVHVYANDPARPRVDLHLHGTVQPKLAANPEEIDLGVLAPGRKKEVTLTLTNHAQETIAITGVRATIPGVEAQAAASIPPGKKVEVLVRGELPPGVQQLNGYLLVQPQAPEAELRIPIRSRAAEPAR